MTEYYVAALGPAHGQGLFISFRRLVPEGGLCWPLPWAGTWPEAAVVEDAAALNDGVEAVAVPREAVHALATAPPPGKIDGDAGPVVRNTAANRQALVLAARQAVARLAAFEIPRACDPATRGGANIFKALETLLPLLGRAENLGNDRLWRLRAELLAAWRSDDRRRGQEAVQAVRDAVGAAGEAPPPHRRPARPPQEAGRAEVAILRRVPPAVPPQPPPPDQEVRKVPRP